MLKEGKTLITGENLGALKTGSLKGCQERRERGGKKGEKKKGKNGDKKEKR